MKRLTPPIESKYLIQVINHRLSAHVIELLTGLGAGTDGGFYGVDLGLGGHYAEAVGGPDGCE